MSGSLSIVFTGLCALVGNGDGRPADMLLLDAPAVGEVRGVTLPAHAPTLVVSLNDLANPDTSAPTRVIVGRTEPSGRAEQLGLWDLSASEVRIRAQGGAAGGVRFFRPDEGATSWPEPPEEVNDPAAWRDIRFVADMEALVGDGRIHPMFLQEDDGSGNGLPRAIATRIHLDAGLIEAAIPSQATYRDDRFEFRGEGSGAAVRQALTDTAQWSLHTEGAAVAIDIVPVDGGPVRRLLLAPGDVTHRLYVSNLPVVAKRGVSRWRLFTLARTTTCSCESRRGGRFRSSCPRTRRDEDPVLRATSSVLRLCSLVSSAAHSVPPHLLRRLPCFPARSAS